MEHAQRQLARYAKEECDSGNEVVLFFGPHMFEVRSIDIPPELGGDLLVCRCTDDIDMVLLGDALTAYRITQVS